MGAMEKVGVKLYFVAIAMAAPEQRILYAVDIRDGFMALSEKRVRGRSGAVPPISEKALTRILLSGSLIEFRGNAETITRKLVGAFTAFEEAEACYAVLDVRLLDPCWKAQTDKVLELFAPTGDIELVAA